MGGNEPTTQATRPRERRVRPTQRVRAFRLVVVEGTDEGASHTIAPDAPPSTLVGTSPACNLRLDDPMVSRRHLALELDGEQLRLRDLDSTNGTRVNGVRVHDVWLVGGERIELGEGTALEVVAAAETTEQPLPLTTSFGRVIGASPAMRRLYPLCLRLAASDVSVVVEGETGTGKEVLAEALHDASPRASGPFIVFDCTTVPANLIESALFGHEKGAFTGATEARKGVFEQAHRGTLLLDEIGDLDLELQAKLLRALERGQVQRVGGAAWVDVDVRVLAATRRDLDVEVQEGRFRDDLFFRLAVTRIELPPLRRRQGDVERLARTFWSQIADEGDEEPPDTFLARLSSYPWPGNVRELKNVVARQVALGDLADDFLGLPRSRAPMRADRLEAIVEEGLPFPRARRRVLEAFEQLYLSRLLERHGGKIAAAAEEAGVARRYFRLLRARTRERTESTE